MIPLFPLSRPLLVSDQEEINQIINQYPPFSDYNFVSLFSWNSTNPAEIALLNSNLVVRFSDYLTGEFFYSFIGTTSVKETIQTLLEHSKTQGMTPILKLIPEVVIQSDTTLDKLFTVQEDPDNFDYIYSLEKLSHYPGNEYAVKRNFVKRFQESFKAETVSLKVTESMIQSHVLHLFQTWKSKTRQETADIEQEFLALQKLLAHSHQLKINTVGIVLDETLIAFTINEILPNGYAVNLFEKANIEFVGIFPYLRQTTAKALLQQGSKWLNHEQDLGIPGLRKSKESYHPEFFLKKYLVSLK